MYVLNQHGGLVHPVATTDSPVIYSPQGIYHPTVPMPLPCDRMLG
jgi:hypothetical protein